MDKTQENVFNYFYNYHFIFLFVLGVVSASKKKNKNGIFVRTYHHWLIKGSSVIHTDAYKAKKEYFLLSE